MKDFSIVIADLSDCGHLAEWTAASPALPCNVNIVQSLDQLEAAFHTSPAAIVIFAETDVASLVHPLDKFFRSSGCLPDFVLVVTQSAPSWLLAEAFEFGPLNFCKPKTWVAQTIELCSQATSILATDTPERRIYDIAKAICVGEQEEIQKQLQRAIPLADFDFRVSFQIGQAHEALGYFSYAILSYEQALRLDHSFRRAKASLADSKMVMGKNEEAKDLFSDLLRTNPQSPCCKAYMASAFVEMNELEKAKELLNEIDAVNFSSPKVLEAKAQMLLATGKLNEAFALMDKMSEVGPFFAAKLNELGIRLSQAGKGESALALYYKAHKIVRADLKYKISLNAALACRRQKLWDEALKFTDRCEKEYGNSFPKLEKIRQSLQNSIANEPPLKREVS